MSEEILSVGIDIGTTTTSMIVSRLGISNLAASYMVPDIDITTKEILYRSPLYLTPLVDFETLDGEKIRQIIQAEYKEAGITPQQVDTGAVIITGESALKKNSEIILHSLSSFAGEFVVATAGPDLESIIAGRGAGAEAFSKTYGTRTANLDIGGGTTNIAVFNCGELEAQTCIDVGGRLIRYDEAHRVTYVSKRFQALAALRNLTIEVGTVISEEELCLAGELLADTIFDSIHIEHHTLTTIATTSSSRPLDLKEPIGYLSFSGGVADCYYKNVSDLYAYHDLGVAIARALHQQQEKETAQIIQPKETIRATVVGAGTYMAEVSGSTISFSNDVFPIKNLPMCVFSKEAEAGLYQADAAPAIAEAIWYQEQMQAEQFGLCLQGKEKLTYLELCRLSEAMIALDERVFAQTMPLVIVCVNDMAKALGQRLFRDMTRQKEIICLDRIRIHSGDYMDIGKPVMDGVAVPVVVKTLIFN